MIIGYDMEFRDMNEAQLTEIADSVDWTSVSKQIDVTKMSDNFFHRFRRNIDWKELKTNLSMTTEFAYRFEDYLKAKIWYKHGLIHRENDLPAIINKNGSEEWYQGGLRHRDNGPAFVYEQYNCELWYKNNLQHREDGPAIIMGGLGERWYYNGMPIDANNMCDSKKVLKKQFNVDLDKK